MATATIQPGAGVDTMLSEAAPTTNSAGTNSLQVGNDYILATDKSYRSLIRFDLTPYLFQEISAAVLTLTAVGGTLSGSRTFYAYRTVTAWTEAATWNTSDGTTNWTGAGLLAGTDYLTTGGDSVVVTSPTNLVFSALGTLAQDALDNRAAQLSLVLIGPEDVGSAQNIIVGSSDHGTAGTRPALALTYTPYPVIERIARCLAYRLGRCTTANGYSIDLEVVRPPRAGVSDLSHGKCTITQAGEAVEVPEHAFPGATRAVAAQQSFEITIHVAADDNDQTPIDTVANLAAADAVRAITAERLLSAYDWAQFEGLALLASVTPPTVTYDGQYATAQLLCNVVYRYSENNPYEVRA